MRPNVAGLATFADRYDIVGETIDSLRSQVDLVYVYDNDGGYEHTAPNVIVDTGEDLGDTGKFYYLFTQGDCYFFGCDDDLIYPPNYTTLLRQWLRYHDDQWVATVHGKQLVHADTFRASITRSYRCLDYQACDDEVHIPGTGVIAFRSDVLDLRPEHFPVKNMADIWCGKQAQLQGVPIVSISHQPEWITLNPQMASKETLYQLENAQWDDPESPHSQAVQRTWEYQL